MRLNLCVEDILKDKAIKFNPKNKTYSAKLFDINGELVTNILDSKKVSQIEQDNLDKKYISDLDI